MRLKSSLFVALVAGSVSSVAVGQISAVPARDHLPARSFVKAKANGVKLNVNGHGGTVDAVQVYNNDGTAPFYATTGLPGICGDHCMLTPGPGSGGPVKLTSIDACSFIAFQGGFAGGDVDILIDLYDTYNQTATPINSVPLLAFVGGAGTIPALTAGQYLVFDPIDITAANVTVPDNDFVAVVRVVNAGTTVPAAGLMPTFCGLPYPLTIGASEDNFLLDVNNNGIFEGAAPNVEGNYWFGGADPFRANILLAFSGDYQGATGACCLPDGSCSVTSSINCGQLGGTYSGNGTACGACGPVPTGRCCKPDGTCAVVSNFDCNTAHGVYGGNNTTCATCTPFGYVETTDVGDLPATAGVIAGNGSTAMTNIYGNLSAGDVDMFQFNICDRTVFSASTVGGSTGDTQMFLFDSTGKGLAMDDDTGAPNPVSAQSIITGQFVVANGTHYLALSLYNGDPVDGNIAPIWGNTNPGAAFFPEWAPNAVPPSTTNIVAGWAGAPATTASYTITLTGACFVGAAGCYANCDHSTAVPILNANDFQCFLNEFASQTAYANCDGSTATPVLNANDFQCFLNAFAGGCP